MMMSVLATLSLYAILIKEAYAVLGLITSKTPALEDKELIKQRIKEAQQYISLDQICLSPQCGFASN